MSAPWDHSPGVHLSAEDAVELVEVPNFLTDWLDDHDSALLGASFRRFVGTTGYELAELQADLDRFASLLSDDEDTDPVAAQQ